MLRIVLGVVAGFIAAIWPVFGANQKAFEAAVKNGGEYTADTTMLLTHLVLGSVVSAMAGIFAALIARENTSAPLVVGILLLVLGLLKAFMSWRYAPIWYHVIFTAILLPMAVVGGKLITTT